MDNAQAKREKLLERIKKLLAMGRDTRGNENETATAMRQAGKLMAELGISEAEADLSNLDAGTMSFGETALDPNGRPLETSKPSNTVRAWCPLLALGVARFTETVASLQSVNGRGALLFRGEKQDVMLARWLFSALADSLRDEAAKSPTVRDGNDKQHFMRGGAGVLQHRLIDAAKARKDALDQAAVSGSRALVVVDRKRQVIEARFGSMRVTKSATRKYNSARVEGQRAGQRVNIPQGRPIANATPAPRLRSERQ